MVTVGRLTLAGAVEGAKQLAARRCLPSPSRVSGDRNVLQKASWGRQEINTESVGPKEGRVDAAETSEDSHR